MLPNTSTNNQSRHYAYRVGQQVPGIARACGCQMSLHPFDSGSEHYSERTRSKYQACAGCACSMFVPVIKQHNGERTKHNGVDQLVGSLEQRHIVGVDGVGRQGKIQYGRCNKYCG